MQPQSETRVYTISYHFTDSFVTAWQKTVRDFFRYRWLIWINFKKDFFSKHKQTGLGMAWALILPIVPVSAYLLLGYIRVLNVKGGMPFQVYMIVGMTFWQLLAGGIRAGMGAIQQEKAVLTKIRMPFIAVIVTKYGNVLADTLIRLIFLVCVLIYFRITPHLYMLLFPLVVLPLLFFGLGTGIILSIVNVINKDVENVVRLILTYGMFVSSVIFPMPTQGTLAHINSINIMNHLIVGIRDFIVFGRFNYPLYFYASSAICILLFIFSIKFQHNLQYRVKGIL